MESELKKMTNKELLNQFDALCKEWYGKHGYSESDMGGCCESGEYLAYYMDRVGFSGGDDWESIEETDQIHHLILDRDTKDNKKHLLKILVLSTDGSNVKDIFWTALGLVGKYFCVQFLEEDSDIEKLYYTFQIKHIVEVKK